ncbi:electron transfer flavoprotein subunit alpha/FixB family protein [Devosia sp. RR2S18]|uniref:electron transfer flavoprotein subunit alpha/FixB family protein n=1 Tax=Devosia rhizosphaerae TaxID=3049774 RepID=UPI002541A3B8|nr:electron transfer flavoprotein subunit alpha/FixB family protein [Devosia sp. RR2S18]WIJ24682.1 electron transfer flavoprotein subunit alpha/FixB family protein [Devosia sp. RR2S18]
MSVLLLADHDLGLLSPSTARLVNAVSQLGPVDLLVLGEGIDQVATEASKISGVSRVLVGQGAGYGGMLPDAVVSLLETLTVRYQYVAAGATAVGRDVMPRLAAKLDLMPITDVVAILDPSRFERPIYAGNAVQTVTSNQAKHLLTLRASAFRAAPLGNDAPIEPVESAATSAARVIAGHRTESDTPDLATAQIVVGGGVSVGSAEGFQLIQQLAQRLNAAVGATRAAVDAGYAPNDWQVGQTGKIIAPDLYIAVGISGALQHLAGIQGVKKIIAINTDAEAPLSKMADVVLLGDLFKTIPELIAELDRLGVKR